MSNAPSTSPTQAPSAPQGGVTAPDGPKSVQAPRDSAIRDSERAGKPVSDRGIKQAFDTDPVGARMMIEDFADLIGGNTQAINDHLFITDEWKSPEFHYYWAKKYGADADYNDKIDLDYEPIIESNMRSDEHFPGYRFQNGEFRSGELVYMRVPMDLWVRREKYKITQALAQQMGKRIEDITRAEIQAVYDRQIANGSISPTGLPDPRSPAAKRLQLYKSPLF